ncbi:hypothetical protein [Achromobacter spanius]|uniref:DNA-binding protein n=1 Tax=Achromobacter spanius TaxID=217203 RepID=A0AAW3HXG7_9BURK|nr:hypothetical protein [Achromobacter spanius]KNE23860.1 hypothetical protein AFM18_26430 [Achromobacter spanius]
MNEENDLIPLAAVEKFFESKNISSTCPACGESKWGVGAAELGDELPLFTEDYRPPPGKKLRMALFACVNCGFIRMHDRRFLQWYVEHDMENEQAEKE